MSTAQYWKAGDYVTWRREMRGGYGYVEHVPGRVEKVGKSKVQIRVIKKAESVLRWVRPENIVPRIGPA